MTAQMVRYRKIIPFVAALLFIGAAGVLLFVSGIPQSDADMVAVRFSLDAPDAGSVALVGDFNQWNPEANILKKDDNVWKTEILLKKGRTYLYNFSVDGDKWITDPTQMNVITDSFGSKSVLEL